MQTRFLRKLLHRLLSLTAFTLPLWSAPRALAAVAVFHLPAQRPGLAIYKD